MKLVEITRTRTLPYAGTVVVKRGQKVLAGDMVAKMNYFPGMVKKLRISKHLAVKPEKLPEVVTVKPGELVNKGDILAFNARWHKAQAVTAPQSGIIGMISRHLGIVYLRKLTEFNSCPVEIYDIEKAFGVSAERARKSIAVRIGQQVSPGQIIAQLAWKDNKMKMHKVVTNLFGTVKGIKNNIITIKNRQVCQELQAYLAGEVIDVAENWSVSIKARAYQLNGVYGIAGERSGILRTINTVKLDARDIYPSDKHKILLSRGVITKEALHKAVACEVSAVIAASCNLALLREYAGQDFIPGITGGEEVITGIILLHGFTASQIDETLWSRIEQLNNKEVSVNGTTHIRAGAIRPEILIFAE